MPRLRSLHCNVNYLFVVEIGKVKCQFYSFPHRKISPSKQKLFSHPVLLAIKMTDPSQIEVTMACLMRDAGTQAGNVVVCRASHLYAHKVLSMHRSQPSLS